MRAAEVLATPRRRRLAVFGAALLLYGCGLGHPTRLMIDEGVYVPAAQGLADGHPFEPGTENLPRNYEHPPLGKILILASVSIFGDNPVGRRLPSLVAGASVPPLLVLIGSLGFGSEVIGLLAAGLWLMDDLAYFMSGIALLDLPSVAFVLGAYAAAFATPRRWWLSPTLLGLGAACKMTAFFSAPFLVFLWLRPLPNAAARWIVTARCGFVAAAVFVASYLPYFAAWWRVGGLGEVLQAFPATIVAMLQYHEGAHGPVGLNGAPLRWFFRGLPMLINVVDTAPGRVAVATDVGNPVVWFLGLGASLVWLWRRLHDHLRGSLPPPATDTARDEPRMVHAATILFAAMAPYFLLARREYQFYAVGFLPFLALSGAVFLEWAWRDPRWRSAVTAVLMLVVAAFLARLPVVEAISVPRWYAHLVLPEQPGLP